MLLLDSLIFFILDLYFHKRHLFFNLPNSVLFLEARRTRDLKVTTSVKNI